MSKAIIINNNFVGGYGFDKNNLPHEVINYFRADDDQGFYIYIAPYGIVKSTIKKEDITGILFVKNAGNGLVEVIAKAELDEDSEFYTQGIKLKSDKKSIISDSNQSAKEISNRLKDLNKKITYGGVSLEKIHQSNKQDNEILLSMKVARICLPKKTFFLAYKESDENEVRKGIFVINESEHNDGKKIANQSMITYYFDENIKDQKPTKESYNKLKEILCNDDLWKDANETPRYDPKEQESTLISKNFFEITRQQDNEVMFSNMFYYYLSEYPDLLKIFIKKVLKINLTLSDEYIVEREKDRMDIRIIDSKTNNYIIIENKIKSNINGMKLAKEDKENKNGFLTENNKYISQLSVYYKKALGHNIFPYIFAPDYSPIDNEYLEDFLYGNEYDIIRYSELYDFFDEYRKSANTKPVYIDDFCDALKKHIDQTDNEHRNVLMQRLNHRIKNHLL